VFGLSSPNCFGAIICHRAPTYHRLAKKQDESGKQERGRTLGLSAPKKFPAFLFS